jgi:hypothetical protein
MALSVSLLAGCSTTPTEVKRLSPVFSAAKIPVDCQIVSVLKDSPAEKAGILPGDVLKSVNGQVPKDAAAFSDVVGAAPPDSDFEVLKKDGSAQHLKVHLNAARPRLGSVCDLAGWEKPGLTAAGNESITLFDGPFALTVSGIIDKNIVFMRVRLTNNMDKPLEVGPDLFKAADGSGQVLAILSPKEVMCFLYGDKGAHLLILKKQHKETLDAQDNAPTAGFEEHCEGGAKGKLSTSDPQYADANAQYLATESLWPATYQPGTVADGLIYFKEPTSLPVTVTVSVEGHTLSAKLSLPVGSDKRMKRSELIQFFQSRKKGDALRLTLKTGRAFVGKLSSYDEVGERAWFDTPSSGALRSTSYSIDYIRNAEPMDQLPAKPTPAGDDLN